MTGGGGPGGAFRNTFAPNMANEYLDGDTVLMGLRFGFIRQQDVPPEVMDEVRGLKVTDGPDPPTPRVRREDIMGLRGPPERTARAVAALRAARAEADAAARPPKGSLDRPACGRAAAGEPAGMPRAPGAGGRGNRQADIRGRPGPAP